MLMIDYRRNSAGKKPLKSNKYFKIKKFPAKITNQKAKFDRSKESKIEINTRLEKPITIENCQTNQL